jgi:PAS domain S-box-containing protein
MEQAKKSDINFQRIGLLDRAATITAYFPLIDELGQKNIGKNFADRPFIPILKQTLKPMLSEVVLGKIGTPKPIVSILAPVVTDGAYGGYIAGILDLNQLHEYLDTGTKVNGTSYTLIDKNGNVILTNRSDQKMMKPFERGKGSLTCLDSTISQWIPPLPANTPVSERWKKSFYVVESSIGDLAEWKLFLEQPLAPFQKRLYEQYTGDLFLVFLLLFAALALAEFLSRKTVVTLEQLRNLTYELPVRLATDGKNIVWPESSITETAHLVSNFREMADSLTVQFQQIKQINVTLEQRVEERTVELLETKQFTNDVLNSLPSNIAVFDADGIITAVNEPWLNFAIENGADEKTLRGVDSNYLAVCMDSIGREHGEGVEVVLQGLRAVLRGDEEKFTTEYPCHSPSKKRWFTMTALRLKGLRTGIVVSHTNITARKQAEEELRNREEIFSLFMKHSPFYTYIKEVTSTESRVLQASENFQQMIGIPGSEMVGKNASELFPAEMAAKITADDWSVVSKGELLEFQEDFKGRHFNTIKLPIVQGDTTYLAGYTFDITERKQAEEQLMESEQRFRLLMENIPSVAVQGYALDGTVLFWNRASELLYGYSVVEAMGANLLDLIIPSEMHEAVKGAMQQMIETGENIPAGELLLKRKDGSRIPVYSSHALVHPFNRQLEMFCLDIDLTDRKQSENKLLEMNQLLAEAKELAESANTAKSQFLANMSHEIRTPMNGVLGMTQLLEMTDLTKEQLEYTSALKLSGNNLMSLISDILDLSKIEAGMTTVEPFEFSLKQCINDIVTMQKFAAREKGLKLEAEISEEIPYLLVSDQLRIKQILLNLIGNAVKFSATGSITVSAHLLEQHGASVLVCIAVRDTGIGIAPESVDQIFKAFTQEDGTISRRYGGTGLGLTISRKLAELLGGTISVESTPGVGSCFSVILPLNIGNTTIQQAAPTTTDSGWDAAPLRILFVEDDQVNITFGLTMLQKLGHSVTVAENGTQCLDALDKEEFDIVLMDIQMPVMNGEEALLEIRTQEKGTTTHLPVIALTAHSMRGDRERLLELGFDGFVSKPLFVKDLIDEMKKVTEQTHG